MTKCKIDGCERDAMYAEQQVCQKHYFRFMRNGSYDLKPKIRKLVRTHDKGYKLIYRPEHPLSHAKGYVYEHRAVIFSKYGYDLPNCEICNAETSWEPYKTHIDHIDENKSNNELSNLRVLCNACNVTRTKKIYHSYDHTHKITVNGISKTPTEWSRHPDVYVSRGTIIRRKRKGFSDFDAVYSKKITHNRKLIRELEAE